MIKVALVSCQAQLGLLECGLRDVKKEEEEWSHVRQIMTHYGPEQPDVPALIIQSPMSSGGNEWAREQRNERSGVRK